MAIDLTGPLKDAIVSHMKKSAGVVALVPVARIYAMTPPSGVKWPFIRYGSPITTGWGATCWDGGITRVTLHTFAETTNTHAGEDRAMQIAAAIVAAMNDFAPDNLGLIDNEYLQTQCIRDTDEADRWHAWCEFNITVVEAA